jgi:hypothetical protein
VLLSFLLRVFENRVLRRIFELKKDEVTGEWIKLHNEELSDLYYSPNTIRVIKSRRMRWAAHVSRVGERRSVCRVLMGKPERKIHLEEPGVEINIKMNLQEVDMDWIDLTQDRDR